MAFNGSQKAKPVPAQDMPPSDSVAPDASGTPAQDILSSVGTVTYEWAIPADRLTWSDNAASVLGVEARQLDSGRAYAQLMTPDSPAGRYEAVVNSPHVDRGEGVAYAIYDHPEMLEDMVETACVLVEDFLDQVLGEIDFDYASGWEDICFNHGPIVSVDFFEKVVVPRYKRIGDRLHAHGIDLWYTDCDGDVRPLLPGFLEAGINCLFPYEVNSCCHPAELLGEYGKDLRIMGGVDKMQLGKGPAAIKAYMETLIPLVERGGYIPFCDHRCPPNVKPVDYLYYLDLKEEMFGLPEDA